MARKKISIADALAALEDQGLRVKVEPIHTEEQPLPSKPKRATKLKEEGQRVGDNTIKLPLRAQHCIAGTIYGPGVSYVPSDLAAQLMSQDRCAIKYDDELRNTEQKSYIVVRKQTDYGVAHVGVQVNSEVFGANNAYVFRGSLR